MAACLAVASATVFTRLAVTSDGKERRKKKKQKEEAERRSRKKKQKEEAERRNKWSGPLNDHRRSMEQTYLKIHRHQHRARCPWHHAFEQQRQPHVHRPHHSEVQDLRGQQRRRA